MSKIVINGVNTGSCQLQLQGRNLTKLKSYMLLSFFGWLFLTSYLCKLVNLDLDSVEAEFTMSSSFGWKLHRIFPKKLTGLPEIESYRNRLLCTSTVQRPISNHLYPVIFTDPLDTKHKIFKKRLNS